MGKTYGVPRSAKGESRILYIFTIKSLAITLVCAGAGYLVGSLFSLIAPMGLMGKVIFAVFFGVVGYIIAAAKIPDSPIMGILQKAGGEQILDILIRMVTFKSKKKLYIYGIDRKSKKYSTSTTTSKGVLDTFKLKK